jgi:hypothetical protein
MLLAAAKSPWRTRKMLEHFWTPSCKGSFHTSNVPGFTARAGYHHSDFHESIPATLAFVVLCEERFSATGINSAAADLTHKTTVLGLLSYNPLGGFLEMAIILP